MTTIHPDLHRIIVTEFDIRARVADLARQITQNHPHPDQPLVIVTVLNGGLVFLADLVRNLPITTRLAAIGVSSYPGSARSSQGGTITCPLSAGDDLTGRRVLIIDDILDTGHTLGLVRRQVLDRKPANLETAVLLRKRRQAQPEVAVDYVGFEIEDEFVVGYGLDYDGRYRNLPYVAVLKSHVYDDRLATTGRDSVRGAS